MESQRALGLVTVNGGCSGALVNRFWVLTARHCVTVDGNVSTALQTPNQVPITATWTAKVGRATRFHDFSVNTGAGSARDRDIILVYLGATNLAEAGSQKIFAAYRNGKLSGRLSASDTVTQYGIGFSTFATAPMTPSGGAGIFRSALFTASNVTATHYDFVMNANNQSGHGGDSGGPSMVTIYGKPDGGIAGVQSTCSATGYLPGAPARAWLWATGISRCTYVSTEPFLNEISAAIKEAPLKTPFITASQVIIPSPHHPFAIVILGWDGGPANPNVEVYVSINKGPDIPAFSIDHGPGSPVFKQPKIGGIEMKLHRRSGQYRYSLKAGGLTLAVTDFIYVR